MIRVVRTDLPAGTVTFLFTDVEGSTRLLHELGELAYAAALAEHRRVLRDAFACHGGVEVDTQGDAFFVAFATAPSAVSAAAAAVHGLRDGPIRVRAGVHTGTPLLTEEGYVGNDVHRAARIAAAGHGGQVLVSASTAALAGTDDLRDLGQHRFKDLSAPERVFQLGDADFPPLKTLYRTNLPIPATPFLGRDQELANVLALLTRADVRLLTLTGPGGTGKTRLGLQAAAEAAERYPDGVFWTPLAPLRDAKLVLEAAGQALGTNDAIAEHIADKSMLVLFDNFEHVVDAAGGISELLAACPNLQLVVTSRELLAVPGEQAYPVPPLEPQDGVDLFLARARAVSPSFVADESVPELCSRLEHLPLALELAAARVSVVSPEQLLARLSNRLDLLKARRGVDPRQQTLRATIEWSYQLLNAQEQQLLARLAVFAGGCTLDAAETICDADLDTLQSLVDKSLVRVRERDRFWMLETIREYAAERLDASGEAEELRRRHAAHFLALAEEAEPDLRGNPRHWLAELEHEHDNLRAALDNLESSGENELVLRFAGALPRFWAMRGHAAEGLRRLDAALRIDERPTIARARALNGAALLRFELGDAATATLRAQEALKLNRAVGDAWGIAYARFLLGQGAIAEHQWAAAQGFFEESVRIFRELGDEHYALVASFNLAWMYGELGDVERDRALHEENLVRARQLGNERMEALELSVLAPYVSDEGRVDEALSMLATAYRIARDLGDRVESADILSRFADILASAKRPTTATRLLSCSETLRKEFGTGRHWVATRNEQSLAVIHAQLDEPAFAEAWEQGAVLTADQAVALALESVSEPAVGTA
jgi:predicted ATPase/class 3 adenylate cyclase